jgi:hypothetical protein
MYAPPGRETTLMEECVEGEAREAVRQVWVKEV